MLQGTAADRRRLLKLSAGAAASLALAGNKVLAGTSRAAADPERIDIVGNKLVRNETIFRLVGVAVGDPVFVRANRTPDDYRIIRDEWHANAVRISLHPCHWRSDPEANFAKLALDITAARSHGLVVILDWHAIGTPGGYVERPHPSWGLPHDAYESDMPLARSFWSEMAQSFARDPGIIFELWNEPVVDDRLNRSTGKHWPRLKSMWVDLLSVVRKSSDAIVLVAGDRFAHDLVGVAANPIDDPRIGYAWHCYPEMDRQLGVQGWRQSLGGLQQMKPVVVTEWGFCRDCEKHINGTPEDFGTTFVDGLLEHHQLSSTAWIWSANAGPPMLTQAGQPTEFGRFVKAYIASVAGLRAGKTE